MSFLWKSSPEGLSAPLALRPNDGSDLSAQEFNRLLAQQPDLQTPLNLDHPLACISSSTSLFQLKMTPYDILQPLRCELTIPGWKCCRVWSTQMFGQECSLQIDKAARLRSANNDSKRHVFWRKRSWKLSRFDPSCISARNHSTESFVPIQDSPKIFDEKAILIDHHDRQPSPVDSSPSPSHLVYSPSLSSMQSGTDSEAAYQDFLQQFPEYRLTWILDSLRRTDFGRLERADETYVDYMGASLYPESLIRVHTDFLSHHILGNTHSVSNTSKLSVRCAEDARQAVLSHFKASSDYTVVFTPNASAALKLIGEAYPFSGGGCLAIGADSHNSVHGIREFAAHGGAQTVYIPSTPHGGFDTTLAKSVLLKHQPRSRDLAPCLFVMTGQSNVSNSKNSMSIATHAASLGYHTVVDAAALAPTSMINLAEYPLDAMVVSFYKMFGYPTGVGALVVKKSFLSQLRRPWFAGGTVEFVQAPGTIVTRSRHVQEQFEDGTINYLQLSAITDGLHFLSAYLPFLPVRLSSLLLYLVSSLSQLRHDGTGKPVVKILSKIPSKRIRSVGEQSDAGFLISLLFLGPTGDMIPNSFIEYAASTRNISLRTGCMCNPGASAALLGIEEQMQQTFPGVTLKDISEVLGRELGVVRISLGLASNFKDVWRVIQFASLIGHEHSRQQLWAQWIGTEQPTLHNAN